MKYSVFTVMMPEFGLEETVKKLHSIGYDGVEWRVNIIPKDISQQKPSYWGYNKSTVDLDTIEGKVHYVREICEEQNLEICALSTYLQVNELEKIEKVILETHMGNIMPSVGLAYRIVSNFAPSILVLYMTLVI